MQQSFDFGSIAHEYDKYYQTDFGKQVDLLEKELVGTFLNKLKSKKLFEIGCGTGHWTNFFSDAGFSIRAIDISEKMLELANAKNIKNAGFEYGNVLNLNLDNETVDNVIAITSIEFTGNLQKAFDEIYRVLKPSGFFICAGLNGDADFWKDKKNDVVYKNATFLNKNILSKQLSKFGNPQLRAAVVIENNKFKDKQYSENEKLTKAAFIAALVQKNNT